MRRWGWRAGGQSHQVQPLLPTVPPSPEQLLSLLLPPVNRSSIIEFCTNRGRIDAETGQAGGPGHQVQPLLPPVLPVPEQLLSLLLPPVIRSSTIEFCTNRGRVDAKVGLAGSQGHQLQPLLPTVPPTPEQLLSLLLPPVTRLSITEFCGKNKPVLTYPAPAAPADCPARAKTAISLLLPPETRSSIIEFCTNRGRVDAEVGLAGGLGHQL
jgi:hypothetical protein